MTEREPALPIVEIINQVMVSVTSVAKSQRNREQGFDFRGIDDVINAVGPKFRQYGVVPAPMLENAGYRDVTTSKGKAARECTVQVRYRFHGPAGDYLDVIVPGESIDLGDKGTAKAMSVAYRIALLQLLALPTDEPDPDHDTYERSPEPDAERLRREIRAMADAKGYDPATVVDDFSRVMSGADIRSASSAVLAEYKQRFQEYPPAQVEDSA